MHKPRLNKLFCIGLNKTGTTSLHSAFEILGIKSFHNSQQASALISKAQQESKKLLHFLDEYTAFSDYPFNLYFTKLDEQYPDSKFILNTRNRENWVRSRLNHDKKWNIAHPNENQRPCDENAKNDFLKHWDETHSKILTYFSNREDFLQIDVAAGEGWEELCGFLELPVPRVPFPYLNRSVFEV